MILHAIEAGSGPPVALLHGLFGQARNLGALQRRLASGHRVLALDLRNHGASPHAAGMDYSTLATDVLETLAARDAWPAALVGHSMGGKTAMAAALLRPAAVRSLLVADIAPRAYAHGNGAIAAALQALPLQPGLTRAAADAALAPAIPDAAIRGFLLQNLALDPKPHWRHGLAEIAAAMPQIEGWTTPPHAAPYPGPALFVAGARSDYLRPEHHAAIRALFPAARFETVPDAGHMLHVEQPRRFGEIVSGFLDASGPS